MNGLREWGEAEGGAGQAAQAAAITAQPMAACPAPMAAQRGLGPGMDRLGGQLVSRPSRRAAPRRARSDRLRSAHRCLQTWACPGSSGTCRNHRGSTRHIGHRPPADAREGSDIKHWGASLQSIERALTRGSLRRRFLELPGVAPGARGQAGARWLTVRLRFLALNQSSLDCGVATSTRAGGSGTFTEMGFANVGQGMHCCIIIGFSDRFVRPAPGGFLPSRRVVVGRLWARTVRSPQKTLRAFSFSAR